MPFTNVEKSNLIRRPNNLKLEGDFYTKTEKSEQFINYLFNQRPKLIKLPATTLKLEGAMEKKTEMQENYRRFETRQERPPLCKKNTNLHLEGDLDITNIFVENYPRYEPQRRPTLTKHDTNLRMSGDMSMNPEYRESFVEFKQPERQKPTLPKNNLVTNGFFRKSIDESKTILHDSHHQIPFLRDNKDYQDAKRSNLKLDDEIDISPEQRETHIDFYKEGDGHDHPHISRSKRLLSHPSNLKSEGRRLDVNPEYRSAYVNFPRERPSLRRPECHIINDGNVSK